MRKEGGEGEVRVEREGSHVSTLWPDTRDTGYPCSEAGRRGVLQQAVIAI